MKKAVVITTVMLGKEVYLAGPQYEFTYTVHLNQARKFGSEEEAVTAMNQINNSGTMVFKTEEVEIKKKPRRHLRPY